jgi:UDP-3-O-[3-hydroxymyristoyl] N-acetylglucosamine deacetylase
VVRQRTLKNPIRATGVGLHTGERVTLVLRPAPADAGIAFRRVDLLPPQDVPAAPDAVADARLCTTLAAGTARVCTVEHLLAALSGLGVDNALIELDGPEVPIMDGSSSPFVFLIQAAGVCEQNAPKRFLRVRAPVEVREGDAFARLEPCEGFRLRFEIAFDHPAFAGRPSEAEVELSATSFVKDVARARTFGFLKDIQALRAQGLARGGSMRNAVVVDDRGVLNGEGLRYADEFVRHKILDAIGDLYLAGGSLIGAFHGCRSGHALNHRLVRTLLATPHGSEWVTFETPDEVPVAYVEPLRAVG